MESFLISLAALAGQNEFQTNGNILLNLLSITEYLIGVILFAVLSMLYMHDTKSNKTFCIMFIAL